jgi:hypothetical protein
VTDITSPPTPPQDHAALRAALHALKGGEPRTALALPNVLTAHRAKVHADDQQKIAAEAALCWELGAPPPLGELIRHHQEGLMTPSEVAEVLPLYPGQKILK